MVCMVVISSVTAIYTALLSAAEERGKILIS